MSSKAHVEMELAGADSDLSLNWRGQRPVRVVIDGGWVKFDYLYREGPFGPGEPEAGFGFPELPVAPPEVEGRLLLREFLSLANGSDDSVLAFVARWGPLHLCRHRLPATHWPLSDAPGPRSGPMCGEVDGDGTYGQEPTDAIRGWARIGLATLKLGLALSDRSGGTGNPSDWRTVSARSTPPADRADATRRLNGHLRTWLRLGFVWPEVDAFDHPPLRFASFEAFGVVARELVIAVINASMAICTACGDPFAPSSRPRAGEDTYCTKRVCKKASRAAASKRYRQRSRQSAPNSAAGSARTGPAQVDAPI